MNEIIMSYPPSTSCGEIGLILHHILNNILPLKTNGTFVEVGANDGKTGSFTYNLAALGWNGLNFEPVPRLYEKCCMNHINHPNVKSFQIGIGESSCETTIIDADTLSTIDTDTMKTYTQTPQFASYFTNNNQYHTIKIEKLDTMLEQNNITNIDLLVLDVEGYEEHVLKGFTIEKYLPKIFIIEIADQYEYFMNNPTIVNRYTSLRKYFKDNNYVLLVNDIVDNVYVHRDTYETLNKEFILNIKTAVKYPQYSYP
jgi:FkbM family methyltransferase